MKDWSRLGGIMALYCAILLSFFETAIAMLQ